MFICPKLVVSLSYLNMLRLDCFQNDLKPMHNIGKVSVNATILYKNQEICNKTNVKISAHFVISFTRKQ